MSCTPYFHGREKEENWWKSMINWQWRGSVAIFCDLSLCRTRNCPFLFPWVNLFGKTDEQTARCHYNKNRTNESGGQIQFSTVIKLVMFSWSLARSLNGIWLHSFQRCNDISLNENAAWGIRKCWHFPGQNKYNNMFNYEKTIKLSALFEYGHEIIVWGGTRWGEVRWGEILAM